MLFCTYAAHFYKERVLDMKEMLNEKGPREADLLYRAVRERKRGRERGKE